MNRLKLMRHVFLAATVVFLVSCSGIRVSQDYEQAYNFSALKTFAWKPETDKAYGLKDNELVDKRIRLAIENQLAAKSYKQIESATPDFFVSYGMTIKQKLSSSNVSGGISIGRSSFGHFGSIGMSTGSQIDAYDQGTLLIDVTNPQEGDLIWRGISTQAVYDHSSPDETTVIVNETVEKVLMQFPPE